MNHSPTVRLAGKDDVEQLSSVGSRAFRDAYGTAAAEPDIERHVATYFGIAAIQAEMQKPNIDYFVAMSGGECMGLLKSSTGAAPAEIGTDNALEIQQLYVSIEHQRKGVGRLLMDHVAGIARDRGADGIWLGVWSQADWAMKFYGRYGFTERGTVTFNLGATEHIDHIMWLPM